MPAITPDILKPLESEPVQAYFSNRFQLIDIIGWILDQIGSASLTISTFSTSEEFLRRLWRLKNRGQITTCSMFCDLRAARKTVGLSHFIDNVFDSVSLCENHSKVVLLANATHAVAIITSQNQTRGDRTEAGVITSAPAVIATVVKGFTYLSENSLSCNAAQSH